MVSEKVIMIKRQKNSADYTKKITQVKNDYINRND